MTTNGIETPVLLLVFSRPDTTRQVFERIRSVRPKKMYIAADGPRKDQPGEEERCREVRDIVMRVDWDCELKTKFRESNWGCRKGSPDAVNWFLDSVGEGIILEDDCLPSPAFFRFCGELLEKYRHDRRVLQITGTNPHRGWRRDPAYSYYFSVLGSTWGWATWQRAWNYFDVNMTSYDEVRAKEYLMDACASEDELALRMENFDGVYTGKITNCWSHQWKYSMLANHGLTIVPAVNLITNIGFDSLATHTKINRGSSYPLGDLEFPLKHPPFMIRDVTSDARAVNAILNVILDQSWKGKSKRLIKKILKSTGLRKGSKLGKANVK